MNLPQESIPSTSPGTSENEEESSANSLVYSRSLFPPKSRWNPLKEDTDTMQGLFVEGVDDQNVVPEELSKNELENCIQVIIQSNVTVNAENDLLESYLSDVDPLLIENMDKILEAATAAIHKAERTAQLATTLGHPGSRTGQESSSSSPRSTGQSATGSSKIAGSIADKGPKVQPSQKIEIAQREIDKLKAAYEQLQKRSEKTIFNLECQMEEEEIRLKELQERRREFNHSLAKEWPDPTTNLVPGEKLINYFEVKNKLDQSFIKGFPTKSKNMKIQLDACTAKIREIGEGLLYVDYEQLVIQYDTVRHNLAEILSKLTSHKRNNTTYVLMLILTRDIIMKEEKERDKMKTRASQLEKEIMKLLKNEENMLKEIKQSDEIIRKLEIEIGKYTAPPVMEYIKHKAQLNDMKKNLQALQRKVIFKPAGDSKLVRGNLSMQKPKGTARPKPRLYTGSTFWNPTESRYRNFSEV